VKAPLEAAAAPFSQDEDDKGGTSDGNADEDGVAALPVGEAGGSALNADPQQHPEILATLRAENMITKPLLRIETFNITEGDDLE